MRFTCDSCGAQYMISDEKVGPGGVKVRCKRCSHVILVKAAPAEPPVVEPTAESPAAPPPPSEEAAGAADAGLDLELGQAFENVFGGGSLGSDAAAAAASAEAAALAPEAGAPEAPAPTPSAAPPPSGEAMEWYVAVNDAQVGPLLPGGVKAKWEAGEVGPDTLVWRNGMGDWAPLSTVTELAQFLAPVPRPASRTAARAPEPAAEAAPAAAPAASPPAADPAWKPAAASALAALASQELASMARPGPVPAGSDSLVDKMELPDGGIEPTGMVPLHLKGVETTGETLLSQRHEPEPEPEPRRESTEVRELRKSTNRRLVGVVVLLCALFGGGVVAAWSYLSQQKPAAPAVAIAPAPPPPAAVPAPVPAPPPPQAAAPSTLASAAPAPAAAPPVTTPAPVAATPPPEAVKPAPPAEEPAPRPAKPAKVAKATKGAKKARAEPVKPARKERKVASAAPAPAAAPPPAPARKGSGDPLLDAAGDDDLLSGGDKKRSVYVPPAPGSDLPDSLTDAQITESILGKKTSLLACVEEQKAADPATHGVLKLRWSISPDGGVRNVQNLTPDYSRQPIAACISGVVRSVRFSKTRSGREVGEYPFRF